MGCSLDLCTSQGCALQVLCGTPHCHLVFTKGGAGSENAALTELKSGKLCHFWRLLQNLDENQKESLLYSQNEPALWYVLMTCLIVKHWKSELLYVTEKSIGFKKKTKKEPLRAHPLSWCPSVWEDVSQSQFNSVMDPCWQGKTAQTGGGCCTSKLQGMWPEKNLSMKILPTQLSVKYQEERPEKEHRWWHKTLGKSAPWTVFVDTPVR